MYKSSFATRTASNSGRFSRFGNSRRPGGFSGGSRNGSGRRNSKSLPESVLRDFISKSVDFKEEARVEVFVPNNKFSDFGILPKMLQNIVARGYTAPTPIQDQVIPLVMNGKDVVGVANTGTGKSGAFLIPLIDKLVKSPNSRALIIVPTRELAQQIFEESKIFGRGTGLYGLICVGGMSIFQQMKGLSYSHNIVIGTPGRLKDLFERKNLDLSQYQTIVLDEVDRMLDMGFITDIEYLLSKLPPVRQSLFFSATLTPQVERVMYRFVKDYVKISVKTAETRGNVEQDIIEVSSPIEKLEKLKELIQGIELKRAIVFVRTKMGAEKLDRLLFQQGLPVVSIHGDKRQSQRTKAIKDFKEGKAKVLIATDVVARGLDISDVTHVINYDLPEDLTDYIHRIGRTGRVNKKGIALTFVEKFYRNGLSR
ncbi:MAG: DEAD/DEAH box helicase [bacterium]